VESTDGNLSRLCPRRGPQLCPLTAPGSVGSEEVVMTIDVRRAWAQDVAAALGSAGRLGVKDNTV
jgi:hypothetical protein